MAILNFNTDLHNLPSVIERLPADVQRQVIEYVEFLVERYVSSEKQDTEENWFWELIGQLDLQADSDEAILEPVVQKLSKETDEIIFRFDDLLSKMLYDLDGPAFYEVAASGADSFLYTRAYVVSLGKPFYYEVVSDPAKFPSSLEDFEKLLYTASLAYERKHGKEFERIPSYVYETMWNAEKWGEKAIRIDEQ